MRIDAFAMNVTSRLKNKKSVNLKNNYFQISCGEFCTEFANSSGGCHKSLDGKNKTRVAGSKLCGLFITRKIYNLCLLFIYQTDS